jgi:acyl dehydratase
MRTVEIDRPASHAALFLGALRSSAKRPGAVTALPEVTYVRPRVVLEAARIARYAKVCGFSEAQGVPVTYPQVLTFPLVTAFLGSADCPWPALGTVHLINRIAQHQPLSPGDALRVEVRTGRLVAHEKGQIFTLEMKILRDGDVVWDGTQSLLRLGVKDPAGPPYASELETGAPLSRQADFSAGSDIGRRYGHVTGDLNPIHLSALSAKLFGCRRAIAHGMWTKARALAALLPRAAVAEAEVTVEFKTPLYLPARPSLWTAREPQGVFFEVRDAAGEKPHLRGRLGYRPT